MLNMCYKLQKILKGQRDTTAIFQNLEKLKKYVFFFMPRCFYGFGSIFPAGTSKAKDSSNSSGHAQRTVSQRGLTARICHAARMNDVTMSEKGI